MLLLYIMTQRGVFYVRNSIFWWWKNNSRLCIDIKIDLLNGIEIAKKIQQENPKIKIIYMKAYSQYSEAIFKTKPTYLLLKPIKKEQIKKSLEKALQEENKVKIFNIEVEKVSQTKYRNTKEIFIKYLSEDIWSLYQQHWYLLILDVYIKI